MAEERGSSNLKSYRELRVWRMGIELVVLIYAATKTFPREEVYGLTSQLRRAAVSVPSNIAEGYARQHRKEYVQALAIAIGSIAEIDTQLEIARQLGYLDDERFEKLVTHMVALRRQLLALRKSLLGSTN